MIVEPQVLEKAGKFDVEHTFVKINGIFVLFSKSITQVNSTCFGVVCVAQAKAVKPVFCLGDLVFSKSQIRKSIEIRLQVCE